MSNRPGPFWVGMRNHPIRTVCSVTPFTDLTRFRLLTSATVDDRIKTVVDKKLCIQLYIFASWRRETQVQLPGVQIRGTTYCISKFKGASNPKPTTRCLPQYACPFSIPKRGESDDGSTYSIRLHINSCATGQPANSENPTTRARFPQKPGARGVESTQQLRPHLESGHPANSENQTTRCLPQHACPLFTKKRGARNDQSTQQLRLQIKSDQPATTEKSTTCCLPQHACPFAIKPRSVLWREHLLFKALHQNIRPRNWCNQQNAIVCQSAHPFPV